MFGTREICTCTDILFEQLFIRQLRSRSQISAKNKKLWYENKGLLFQLPSKVVWSGVTVSEFGFKAELSWNVE